MKLCVTPLLKFFLSAFFLLVSILDMQAQQAERLPLKGAIGFIENKGQFRNQRGEVRKDLLYMYVNKGMKVQLLPASISFEMYSMEEDPQSVKESDAYTIDHALDPEDRPIPDIRYKSSRIDVEFIGANPSPEVIAEEMKPDYLNYFLAFTPKEGIKDVRLYNKVTYKNLYDHIDLVFIASPSQYPDQALAYDFIVHPGGNVNDIRYRYQGSSNRDFLEDGTMVTANSTGRMFEMIPESYLQNKSGNKLMPVAVSFARHKDFISFEVGAYDKKQSLVIDPVVIWGTYAGGLYSEEGRGVCVDSDDNVILVGRTYSSNGIATDGAFQTELLGDVDMQIEKYTSNCVRLWGTYWGGSKTDHIRGVITDKYDNLYFGSHTDSPDGIAAGDPDNGNYIFREQFAGGDGDDGVLGYFTKDGYRKWATYFGGLGTEVVRRLKFDIDGNIILVGYSESDSGITTPGTYQPDWHGNSDLMLIKWDTTGHRIWGTYLGGESEDHGRSVATDDADNIYVNGSTGSKFGIKKNAFKDSSAGGQDYLLAKFTKDGNCKWSTYWGGEVEDRGRGVYVDKDGEFVYFTGYSASEDGVTLPGAFQTNWSEGYDAAGEPFHDAVLMKWSTNGYPIWSTFIGGPKDDRGRAITMIGHEVYIGGTTSNSTVMSTPDGFQPVFGGNDDMFIEHFDADGNRKWGSYIGEEGSESTLALAVDKSHTHIYQVGTTSSIDIATPGVAQVVYGGYEDAYLVKIQVDTVTAVNSPAKLSTVTIYPDPNQGVFSLKYHLTEPGNMSIYNMKGELIHAQPLNVTDQKITVTTPDTSPGIYTCKITANGKELVSRNFIIIR